MTPRRRFPLSTRAGQTSPPEELARVPIGVTSRWDDRFVVEVDRRTVGVAVRAPRGFQFFASDPAVGELDSRVFAHAKTLIKEAEEAIGRNSPSGRF